MKKIFTHTLLFIVCLSFIITNNSFAQQQYPERIPFNKTKNRTVAAVPLSGFNISPISPAQLVSYLLGPGAAITNLTYTGSLLALGLFADSAASIGIDTGIVISTGNVMDIPGPNTSGSTSTSFSQAGDLMLTQIAGNPTYDAAVIEFDVLVLTDTLGADFVFGSEEYPEFANSSFNDLFAFFVSGPGINGTINIAHIPGDTTIISINNINNGQMNTGPCMNCQYYVNNSPGLVIEYDGYTVPFSLEYPIINGQTYHFKIAVADCSDGVFDSGIFLKKGSVLGKACLPVAGFTSSVSGLTAQFTNTTNYAQFYTWDYGDGNLDTTILMSNSHTYAQAGMYDVTLQAHNYYQTGTITQTLNVGGVGIPVVTNTAQDIKLQIIQAGIYKVTFGKATHADIRVYAITGELKYSSQGNGSEANIDLGNLSKGLYMLQISTPDFSKTLKLIR